MPLRQIEFLYDGLPNEFAIRYDEHLPLDFVVEPAKHIPFTFEEQDEVRELVFSMGRDSTALHFPVSQATFSDAILGVMDPYTLGELDDMSLDFKMWPDMSGLVPDGLPGADGVSIFAFTEPLMFLFQHLKQYTGLFNVGDLFIDERNMVAKKIYLYLRNEQKLAKLSTEKVANATDVYMQLKAERASLVSDLVLYCKSLFGKNWTLGEMDPFTLGDFDPLPLWQLSGYVSSALNIMTSMVDAETTVEPNPLDAVAVIQTATKATVQGEAFVNATGINKRITGSGYRRQATLGDMDDFTFETLDARILGMYFYGKTPAIVTAD